MDGRGRRFIRRFWAAVTVLLLLFAGPAAQAQETPSIIGPSPVSLTSGQRLDSLTRNYTARNSAGTVLAGRWQWEAPGGVTGSTALSAGTFDATLTFIPNDTENYGTAATNVEVTVQQAVTLQGFYALLDGLTASSTRADIEAAAELLRRLSDGDKRRVPRSRLERMIQFYEGLGVQDMPVDSSRYTGSRAMPDDAFIQGAALANAGTPEVLQEDVGTGSLRFTVRGSGGAALDAPVIITVSLPDTVEHANDYYIKDADGYRSTVTPHRPGGDDHYKITFVAPTTLGQFTLTRKSSGRSDRSDREDDEISDFWLEVIDDIYRAESGERIRVNIGSRSTVPADVMRELRGRNVTLAMRDSNGDLLVIYGRDVERVPSNKESYRIRTLEQLYGSKDLAAGTPEPMPTLTPVRTPDPTPAPAPPQPPQIIYVPVPEPTPCPSQTPEPTATPQPDSREEKVMVAEEEPVPTPAPTPTEKPREQTGGDDAFSGRLSLPVFMGLAVITASLGAALLTLLFASKRKRRS